MRKIPVHKIRGGDLRHMTPRQLAKFHKEVEVIAQRLLDSVRKHIAQYGPWIYARFWHLARQLPIIKNAIDWRDDTIEQYQELADEQLQALIKRKNPERNRERNSEIMRLHRLGMTPGRIKLQIRKRWPTLENGKPLNVGAIKSVIRHRTKGRRQRKGTI
jgi:hypothetical protein